VQTAGARVSRIRDPEVQLLAALATTLEPDYIQDTAAWDGSPFKWIKTSLPSRTVGAVGEALVAGWAAAKGFDVARTGDSEADRIINGHRIEIKFSTLWANGGYKFQQIRDQRYDYCFCLGISPFDANAWLLPKAILHEYVIGSMGQHSGAAGRDTAWLGFKAGEPYEWMGPYGGRLADVALILAEAGRGSHQRP
jgi:hypothetical protein